MKFYRLLCLVLLLLAAPLCAAARAVESRPPNILFILADDLGWSDLGSYGSEFYETPHIDRLRAQGMKFTQAYSNGPNCAPTRASLMTGTYTPRHGITQVGDTPRGGARARKLREIPSRTVLPATEFTLAEALRAAGYATGHLGKWHLGSGFTGPEGHGFDVNLGGNAAGSPPGYHAPYRRPLPGLGRGEPGEYLTDRLTDEAIRFLEARKDRPFFLYLSHFAVHSPIQAKRELAARFAAKTASGEQSNAPYAAMIQSLDQSVGRVLGALDRLGLAEETVVIFTSDNGGWSGATSNRPLRGYKGMLYEGGIRVPLIVRWPGKVRPGSTSDVPVVTLDFYPTLLELAGRGRRPAQTLDGVSLLPLLRGSAGLERRALYWHFPHYLEAGPRIPGPWRTTPVGAIREGDFKLLHFFESGRQELYDLRHDPGESRDLAPLMPDRVWELDGKLRRWRREIGASVPQPERALAAR